MGTFDFRNTWGKNMRTEKNTSRGIQYWKNSHTMICWGKNNDLQKFREK